MSNDTQFYGLLCFAADPIASPQTAHDAAYPHLHLNLWEQGDETILDIGLLIPCAYPFATIKFYFPWKRPNLDAQDLVERINDAESIASIFNESWTVTRTGGSHHATVSDPTTSDVKFELVNLSDCKKCVSDGDDAHHVEIDVVSLVRHATSPCPAIYVRFRVFDVPTSFYSVGQDQGDAGLVSSWTKTEDLDFRLNVRRGAPPDMERRIGKFVQFSKVHLFLMRDRRYELTFQDSAFKACRSLEDEEFWAKYAETSKRSQEDTLARIQTCFGYQWSKKTDASGLGVGEFRILARFKKTELSKRKFVLYVLVLGALGNGAWECGSHYARMLICYLFDFLCAK